MNPERLKLICTLGTALLLSPSSLARADAPARAMQLGQGSRLWVEGDSTLHKYRLDAKEMLASFELDDPAAPLESLLQAGKLKHLDLRVAVRGLTSGDGGLDGNLRAALKADVHHEIRFQMDSYQIAAAPDGATLVLKGRLAIAGVEKPVELEAKAVREGDCLHVTGAKQLRMTDYGIKPPTFMLGAMSVRDPIDVHFDLRIVRPVPAAP